MKNKFFIKTFGCKTNQTESAIITQKMIENGFIEVKNDLECDYYIVNSCSVTKNADDKAISSLNSIKNKNNSVVTVLTGCFAQLNPDFISNINCDYIVGNSNKYNIPEIIKSDRNSSVEDIFKKEKFDFEVLNQIDKTRAILKIQDGCNNRCSYCTICLARGFSRSLDEDKILNEFKILSDNGYNEVVLTGIHIGLWGLDFKHKTSLADLIFKLEKTNIKSFRIGSLNPNEITDELLYAFSKSTKICPHFHISIQSCSDKILSKMNRRYDFGQIEKSIIELKKIFPDCFIGSDVIVGFPSETDDDFNETYEKLRALPLSQIHVFPFSRRKNTAADKMPNQNTNEIKKLRTSIIKKLSDEKLNKFLNQNLNSEHYLTVEKLPDKKTKLYKGVTPNYIKVLFPANKDLINKYVKVKITKVIDNNCYGEIIQI